jgi:hypothetical protein
VAELRGENEKVAKGKMEVMRSQRKRKRSEI